MLKHQMVVFGTKKLSMGGSLFYVINVCGLDIIMSNVQNRSRRSKYHSEKQPNRRNKQGMNNSIRQEVPQKGNLIQLQTSH